MIVSSYGVLIRVSPGYPPVKGRLHTRYAPVRRSPAPDKSGLLPLDLHVLGLPLAFILSQDQTLHSKSTMDVEPFGQHPKLSALAPLKLTYLISP